MLKSVLLCILKNNFPFSLSPSLSFPLYVLFSYYFPTLILSRLMSNNKTFKLRIKQQLNQFVFESPIALSNRISCSLEVKAR